MTPLYEKKYYFRAIDGLRLVASINIVLFHLEAIGGLYNLSGSPAWLFRLIKGPAVHSTAFFILGGFIFTIKHASHISKLNTKKFLIGRLKDLYPLHVVTTFMMVTVFLLRKPDVEIPKLFLSLFLHLSFLWSFYPLHTYTFNTPSWALSAFFLCYILFGPVLRLVIKIEKRRLLVLGMAICILPLVAWSYAWSSTGFNYDVRFLYHTFAPVRFFEFLAGMLLARLFQKNTERERTISVRTIPGLNDALIITMALLIYVNLRIGKSHGEMIKWMSYHVFMMPLYLVLLYRLARENGIICKILTQPFIRQMGQASFYPYLLHVPLISWLTWSLERFAGYRKFLHSPRNVIGFMIVLYLGSGLYFQLIRKPRRKRERESRPAPQTVAASSGT